MYMFFPLRKRVAKINLKIAFPKKNNCQINYLLKKTYQHFGLLIFEFIRQKNINIDKELYIVDDVTASILNKKNGIICMTAHLGNWEMMLPIISLYKNFTVIVREQKNSSGDKFFYKSRSYKNVFILSKKESKREMLKNLNAGHILGLASDQNAHDRGTETIFFNKKASFPKGAGHFYFMTNSSLVIGFCILNKKLEYNLKLREINLNKNYEQKDELIVEVNKIYAEILEKEITKYPEQYFWFHKKWDKNIYK